jgi:hypothetical protein
MTSNTTEQSISSNFNYIANAGINIVGTALHNTVRVAQPALYSYLGAATLKEMPLIGKISPMLVGVIALSNIASRCEETSACPLTTKKDIAHHHHEIMADYMVSIGVAGVTYGLTSYNADMAKYIVSTFFVTNVAYAGEQSPVDHLKIAITGGLDMLLGEIF